MRLLDHLEYLPPQVNGLALGIGGLGILWRDVVTLYEYDETWNTPSTFPGYASHIFAYLCHLTTLSLVLLYIAKAIVHRRMFFMELRAFAKVGAVSTGPMALATVCTSLVRLSLLASQILWIVALSLHIGCTVFFLAGISQSVGMQRIAEDAKAEPDSVGSGIHRKTSDWSPSTNKPARNCSYVRTRDTSSPWNAAAFPPTVGVAALGSCSTGIEFPIIALTTLIVGVFWAILILTCIFVQHLKSKSVDKEARAAILCAPYALCGAACWAVRRQFDIEKESDVHVAFNAMFIFLNIMALLLYVVVLSLSPLLWLKGSVAAPGSAAFTFPSVIVATCLVRSGSYPINPPLGEEVTRAIAWPATVVATLVVVFVIFQFVRLYLERVCLESSTPQPPTDSNKDADASGDLENVNQEHNLGTSTKHSTNQGHGDHGTCAPSDTSATVMGA